MTNTNQRNLIQQLAGLARRKHYTCEDPWYSCPQSECGSANDNAGAECDCGADEHNAKVDAICAALTQSEPTLTVEDCSNMHKHKFNFLDEDRFGEIVLDGIFTREDLIEIANTVPSTEA
jgi:hypothetical protein